MTHTIASANGILYVVATPIGNQADITKRAVDILKSVDWVAAEDTRHAKPFLEALGVRTKCIAFHAHNEAKATTRCIDSLKAGENIALISDAGTPLIRDPGYPLVVAAHEAGIQVVPIPGACALIAALSAAGVPSELFTFGGFLPAAQAARQKALQAFVTLPTHTLVFYESTHRLLHALKDIEVVFGDTVQVVLAKELTKLFEAFVRGTPKVIKAWLLSDSARIKGEFVIMLPPRPVTDTLGPATTCLKHLLAEDLPLKKAVKIAAQLTGAARNRLYQWALENT